MISKNLEKINERIAKSAAKAGRDPREITLVAVTKTVGTEEILELLRLGVTELGENRVQDAFRKQKELSVISGDGYGRVRWHLIGSLQSNKARFAVDNFHMIHSLDRWRLAVELNKKALSTGKTVSTLIQVNVSGETTKHGISPVELPDFYREAVTLDGLELCGLMTMAPFTDNPEETRPVFAGLRELFRKIQDNFSPGDKWRHLSMGMSNDYEVAVEEGATIVRIGTAIFTTPGE